VVWPSWSRPCGHAGIGSESVAREESRAKKTAVKKRLSPLLTRFADDGCLKTTNYAAERASRPIALGRKNFFTGSDAGGRRAAIIYTLIKTANLNDGGP
jgi:Transposase IS66 family